ncbi:hypothetical protein H6P81_008250 [Aristolochia fimbriata]|uniref:Uncharacterized protein n=1 Tax=Aristolochia fimbriata TaxID=158543 RepID=A0AAV7F3R7_ARIFI|nr:hypothetical protein H6P81_008250 [Aristolochia fimbriata]
MANPGGVGSKFVSVNLNKSYGRNPNSISHGPNSTGSRFRSASHGSGGMVVLSRPRSSLSGGPKMGPRFSVPPPLNLPSLRKEHERFDLSASGGSGGTGPAGSGSGHSTSAMGWTKPGFFEKDGAVAPHDDGTVGASSYVPPAARATPSSSSSAAVVSVEKAVVLRGEDFPTLHAALPLISSGPSQRQKDLPKQKLRTNDELSQEKLEMSNSGSELHMRPQIRSRLTVGPTSEDNGQSSLKSSGSLNIYDKAQKQDSLFSVPLPLVRLTHTSDWADDERDTGHGVTDREKDNGYSRGERDFDIPKPGIPRGLGNDFMDGRVSRDLDNGKVLPRGGDSYGRDVRIPSREGREGSSWRSSQLPKDGFNSRDMGSDRSGIGVRSFSLGRDMGRDNAVKYNDTSYRESSRDGFSSGAYGPQDSRYLRRDSSYGNALQNGVRSTELFGNKGSEQSSSGRYGDSNSNRFRNDVYQGSSTSKSYFSSGSKGFSVNDPILNFGRERRLFSNSKPYLEDTLGSPAFDGRDPFSGSLVFKKKKDAKQTDFHDPVRESFEAELEQVQKMQEQERQRLAEEQARALELARKEEEERQRLAREEEERRRRLEEEAREAAWRAEKERLEVLKRAEEQRIAREEEKRRILLEEERRKEAARQKLLELEARIAKRQGVSANIDKVDERLAQRDTQRVADIGDWEDGERMVERITSSASSDSSGLNRTFETGSRIQSSRDGNSAYMDRGKQVNSWKRDAFDNGNNSHLGLHDSDNSFRSPRREQFNGGKSLTRKEFYGSPGVMPLRKGGMPDPHPVEDFPQFRGQRWNAPTESDHYSRNPEFDYEFPDNSMDKFADIGWGQGRLRNIPHSPISDRFYQNPDVDGFSSFSRSRHSMRQPRVLPPPSITTMHRSTFRTNSDRSGSSAFADDEARFSHGAGRNEDMAQMGYEGEYQEKGGESGVVTSSGHEQFKAHEQAAEKHAPRCDSQSSLSVSSPPSSPTHLSHDDLDDTGGSPGSHAVVETEQTAFSDNDQVVSASRDVQGNNLMGSHIVSPDEDEEWTIENNEDLQEQEEYDEEEDGGYQEEDEVHEGEDANLHLSHEFADLAEEDSQSNKVDQLVLGFDEGIEVRVPSSEEFENASQNNDKSIGMQETGSADGLVADSQGFKADSSFTEGMLDNCTQLLHGSEKSFQDLVMQPMGKTEASDNVEEHSGFVQLQQQPVTSSSSSAMSSNPVQPISSSVSPVPNQTEVSPVKLQFGLFSGPSLIPSPVPAIQIGSIQMPLLHPQVGSSLTQIHPSQPPYFQFGQLRYTSPISQGILPLGPQTMSFVQPNVSSHYPLNQQIGGPLHSQSGDSAAEASNSINNVSSVLTENQAGHGSDFLDPSQVNQGKELIESQIANGTEKESSNWPSQVEGSHVDENKARAYSIPQVGDQAQHDKSGRKNYRSVASNAETQGQSSRSFSSDRVYNGSRPLGMAPSGKGKRLIYTVKNNGSRSSVVPTSDATHSDSNGLQRKVRRNLGRTEFRVRENVDRRQAEGLISSNYQGQEEKLIPNTRVSGNFIKGGVRKDGLLNKPLKSESGSHQTSGSFSARNIDSEGRMERTSVRDASSKRQISALDGKSDISGSAGEDVDPPLQSGVVRVFKQSGIEAPSDEDDFIEVRSKRQMLNDRREQREKEFKAKSRVIKAPRKPRSVQQSMGSSSSLRGTPASVGGDMATCVHSESDAKDGRNMVNVEVPIVTAIASPPLPPIGTPSLNADAQANIRSLNIKSIQAGPTPVISSSGTNFMPSLPFDTKTAVMENVSTTLAPWANPRISQQVMALTQTQLDEAMKPGRFDGNVSPIVDHTAVKESSKPSTSILSQDGKPFPPAGSPLNSLLAGEKIQFGAVTSPTILPPSTCSISNGIGPSGSCRSEVSMDHKLSASDSIFYDKEKHAVEPCPHLEDPEAEAEAAASAVAVAAISNDEVVGNGLSVSGADSKSFGSSDIGGLSSGGDSGNQQSSHHSKGEESLTVALPADLSVETPSLSLWPTLPSPSNSSNTMLSPFPGAPPFPCYEMNPMLGGPIFAFGPQDESANTKSQSQKGSISTTGPIGAWQQCHSGVDSFYGPPTGFSGPFISPPGGIPGMQGPPHMVVYNHFAPVGQFGQVGLSFMGTTYIPSGKQPDWKHTPVSSAVGISEGDINSINIASAQRNPQNITGPIQHLASGSPLLPMASPLAMFDMSPFQSTADMPMQARWPHVPASPLHSVPLSMPLQQADGLVPSQFNHGLSVDPSTGERLKEPRVSAPMENNRKFSASDSSQFPDELGLMEATNGNASLVSTSRSGSYSSTNGSSSRPQSAAKSSTRSNVAHTTESGSLTSNGNGSSSSGNNQSVGVTFKSQSPLQQNTSYLHPVGYSDQRGSGSSQKVGSGGEWHRRVGFQARTQTAGSEKNFSGASKMKQIYVAKPATSSGSTTAG